MHESRRTFSGTVRAESYSTCAKNCDFYCKTPKWCRLYDACVEYSRRSEQCALESLELQVVVHLNGVSAASKLPVAKVSKIVRRLPNLALMSDYCTFGMGELVVDVRAPGDMPSVLWHELIAEWSDKCI